MNQRAAYGNQGEYSLISTPGSRSTRNIWTHTDSSGTDTVWLFGGQGLGSSSSAGLLNDLWQFDPLHNQWRWVGGSTLQNQTGIYGVKGEYAAGNWPGGRVDSTSWTATALDGSATLWLFGGLGHGDLQEEGYLNDLWQYNPQLNQWRWMGGSKLVNSKGSYGTIRSYAIDNTPGARIRMASWTVHHANGSSSLWLFGGNGYGSEESVGRLNDLWQFSSSSGEWRWITGDNTVGSLGMYGTEGAFDPDNQPGARASTNTWLSRDESGSLSFLLFGGDGYGQSLSRGRLNDLWEHYVYTDESAAMPPQAPPIAEGSPSPEDPSPPGVTIPPTLSPPIASPPGTQPPQTSPSLAEQESSAAPEGSGEGGGTDIAVIAGAVGGGVALIAIIIIAVWYRKKSNQEMLQVSKSTEFWRKGSFMKSNALSLSGSSEKCGSGLSTTKDMPGTIRIKTGISVLDTCLSLATAIINMTRRVVANHARCERLALRIGAMLPLLNALQEYLGQADEQLGNKAAMLGPVLEPLHGVLQRASNIIEQWSQQDRSFLSALLSMSRKDGFESRFREVSQDLSESFNDLALALQLQVPNFSNSMVSQTQNAARALDPGRSEGQDKSDAREDLKDMAETLAEHGHSWDKMTKEERVELQKQYQSYGLDLQALMKQERQRTIQEKIRDLKISWADVQLAEVVGQGGYGKVRRGYWRSIQVAIKEFSQSHLTERMKRLVHHEAYIMSLLRHPNIAVFYGIIDEIEHFALVLEYYGRGSVAHVLESNKEITWAWKLQVVTDIAFGMEYLHSRPYERVVHGDLKPENVLLNDKGTAVVTDFGVSRVQSYTNTVVPFSSGLSLCYAAPELFINTTGSREPSSDVYSFGMLMFAVATRTPPFSGVDPRIVTRLVEDGRRPAIPSSLQSKHPDYVKLMCACWSQDPAKRPKFLDIAKALKSMQE